ncbi:RelA/SpoT domain-containing protein [Acinetobacter baumannii]|uniref:GTP pyrophosphokinase n=1 Tax=Acinetobacter baumannii TaxID=470 RepID=UPI0018ABCE0C|nr:RelA/SpoT domain-containing protein [Acinetobacter baumannii]EKU0939676.1 RelA/SpoT domain-containing protein [Acinetobacter baumannii]EKX7141776.1 RelA/SpoT domain-containing protein [Acinetobacter baumannii]MCZ2945476.1 RelA/SpoT domain-containing protein [Acinetobacter baumannii]MCZ3333160.1 RelA/SpoT domain-containing protein [Acinetobacter baumannii]MDC5339256.1 RelA/SpoT domain-containing protein [Acinetobacter baumannii]
MSKEDFSIFFNKNSHAFEAWGKFIIEKIKEKLTIKLEEKNITINEIIKIEPSFRVKDIGSALDKIERKSYNDPINQMTDIVGVRFVVLLTEQIAIISNIIESESLWQAKVSKDYTTEIEQNPSVFDYQSKHYEIRPTKDITYDNLIINPSICCEIQIRTLLQHAYAEIVHDNIYKPKSDVSNLAKRKVAKGMALMETTDDLFCEMQKLIAEETKERDKFSHALKNLYIKEFGPLPKVFLTKTHLLLIDTFEKYINSQTLLEIEKLLEAKPVIKKQIKRRASSIVFFSQPLCLITYWLVENFGAKRVRDEWPLNNYLHQLDIVFSDLGVNPELY